jgi:CubicO group peptidase (beta-lactamase class C family)
MLLPITARALVHRLARGQADGRMPSMVGAVAREAQLVWSHGIEASLDTQFRIGSLTKTFVAVMVMRLRDEGLLDLADPLEKYLAGTRIGHVTIGQLLAHTAGLASETPGPWWERTPGELRPTLSEVLGDAPLKHPVGRRFHYSNPGYAALGSLVERLRGRPWSEALEREILGPLEMTRTSLLPRAPHAEGWAVHPWADVLLPEAVHEVGQMAPAGQLWSTAEDLCHFATLLAGGVEGVLAADTAAEMRLPHSAPEPETWDTSYGLGMQTCRVKGRMLAGHTGSMPGFLCALWVSVEERTSAVVLANATSGVAIGALAADLVGIVADREPLIPAPWRPMLEVDASLLDLVGPWYWGPSGFALKLVANRGLELSPIGGAGGRSASFRPAPDGTWVGMSGYFGGETLRPVRDAATGRLTHLDIGSFAFTRTPYDPDAPIPGGVDPGGWRSS